MALSITVRHTGTATVIHLTGELDLAVLPELDEAITAALPPPGFPGNVIVDLAHLTFLDCAGIGALVAGRARAAACDSDLRIRNPRHLVRRLLTLTGTLDYLARPSTPRAAGPGQPDPQLARRAPS